MIYQIVISLKMFFKIIRDKSFLFFFFAFLNNFIYEPT